VLRSVLEDADFAHISSCLFVHHPVNDFVRADSNQVSFNTMNDAKFSLLGPEKWITVFVFAHVVGKFVNGVLYRSTICYFQH